MSDPFYPLTSSLASDASSNTYEALVTDENGESYIVTYVKNDASSDAYQVGNSTCNFHLKSLIFIRPIDCLYGELYFNIQNESTVPQLAVASILSNYWSDVNFTLHMQSHLHYLFRLN